MTSKIILSRCEKYDSKIIKEKVLSSINQLGGIEKFIQKGNKVLLKPNMLTNTPPEKAVTTHPEVVRAVAEIALEAGGIVSIGDSPAILDIQKCAKSNGILKVCEDLNIPLAPFDETVFVDVPIKSDYKRLEIARPVWESDVIINLPKVKTHVYMYLTLAIKNCFGIVKGIKKSKWHIEAGKNTEQFSKMLLSCWQAMNPNLTVVDGIIGMEGDGPQGGEPRKLNFLMVGSDCAAIDRIICEILKFDVNKFPVIKLAEAMKLGETNLSDIEILGEQLNSFDIPNFKTPGRYPALPQILFKYVRDHVTDIPVINQKKCRACGNCIKICPAGAISLIESPKRHYLIDTKKCIRCFCCHEICPHKAIFIKKPIFLKIVEKFFS